MVYMTARVNLLAVAKVNSQQAVVTDAKMMYRFSPEIMYSYGRFAVIGQYYLNTIE